MEIVHLILGKANPNRMSGVNKVVHEMACEQAKHGLKVAIWGITKDTTHNYPERNVETRLFCTGKHRFSIDSKLKKAIKDSRNTVFHLHGGWVAMHVGLCNYLIKLDKKYVLTPHGAYNKIAMQRSWFKKKIFAWLFEKRILNNAHAVHNLGASEIQGLHTLTKKAKSCIIPYGFNFHEMESKKTDNEKFIIGFIGRFDIYTKGLDVILEAFQTFKKQYVTAELWMIGGGADEEILKEEIKSKNIKDVVFFGGKFGEEKMQLLCKMNVFVHASRNEGLPASILEAASVGVPIIATEATNLAEYINSYQAGYGIPNENAEALHISLEKLYTNRKENVALNAKRMLANEFSWSTLVPKYYSMYQF